MSSADGAGRRLGTESGVRIERVAPEVAADLLERLGRRGPDEIWVALAAMQGPTTVIGVAVLGATPADLSRIMVGVVPERRRLRVGTDLLRALLDEAVHSDCRLLRISYPLDDVAADRFLQASGLVTGRQVLNDTVTVVLSPELASPRR